MPTFDYTCEICGHEDRAWRKDAPPRFCSHDCMARGLAGVSRKHLKYPITPEIATAIEAVYKRDSGNGQVAALAKRLNYPRWKITRYAAEQGLVPRHKKEPDWSEQELHILEQAAHLSPVRIQLRLQKYGYRRSATGIVIKRKRMRYLKNLKGMPARQAALCFGVDDHFIIRAIKHGKLVAERRGTDRTTAQGGDQWFIKERHIRDYIMNNLNEIDIRKVDKYWFVDLLTNGVSIVNETGQEHRQSE